MRPSVPCRFPQRQIEPALLRNSLARPSPLLISAHMSLKGDLSPFSVGFLHTAFAPLEVSVGDKAAKNRREKSSLSQEWRQGKKPSDHLWMQRWCFSSIPLTGFVPCVKPKQGMGKEILSLLCPTSVDSNMQMTFYKINRGQGLALESWQWHPRQDHGERGQTQRKLAVLGFPVSAACLCLLEQLNFFHTELVMAGEESQALFICRHSALRDLQSPSVSAFHRMKIIWERAEMGKTFAGVQNARQWIQDLPDPCKIMEFY